MEDNSAAIETVRREKASSDPGSVGAPMSGVVVEVRVKEGQEVKKGDVLCVQSAMKVCTFCSLAQSSGSYSYYFRWRAQCPLLSPVSSSAFSLRKATVSTRETCLSSLPASRFAKISRTKNHVHKMNLLCGSQCFVAVRIYGMYV